MTHSPSINRKRRVNEFNDLDHLSSIKRSRTKSFTNGVTGLNEIQFTSQSSNCDLTNGSHNKEQISHHSFVTQNNEFLGDSSGYGNQPHFSSHSQEYSAFETDFKYLPDLNATENPYYYENNKLLFECYVERLRRASCHSINTSHQF